MTADPDDTEVDEVIAEAEDFADAIFWIAEKYEAAVTNNMPRWQDGVFLRHVCDFTSDIRIVAERFLFRDTDDLIARLKGERGTALQTAACYRAQRDLAWAEIDKLKEQLVEAKAESRHLANNLDVQRLGRKMAELGGIVRGPTEDPDTQTVMYHFDESNDITAVDAEVIQREIDRWSETLKLLKDR